MSIVFKGTKMSTLKNTLRVIHYTILHKSIIHFTVLYSSHKEAVTIDCKYTQKSLT